MTHRSSVLACAMIATAFVSPSHSFAEACEKWSLAEKNNNSYTIFLNQDNKWSAAFTMLQDGTVLTGRARSWGPGDISDVHGVVRGVLKGSTLQLRVQWDTGPVGMYKGSIDENGAMTGATWDNSNPNVQFRWVSQDRSRSTCVSYANKSGTEPPAPISKTSRKGIDLTDGVLLPGKKPAPDPAPPPPQMATVNTPTDIYTGPGGEYDRLGFLTKFEKVQVLGQQNGWTKIKYFYPPTNNVVWVWGEHLT